MTPVFCGAVLNPLDLLDLLHVHADLKIDRIHLNARDEFLLSRAFSLGHHRNFWIRSKAARSARGANLARVKPLRKQDSLGCDGIFDIRHQ